MAGCCGAVQNDYSVCQGECLVSSVQCLVCYCNVACVVTKIHIICVCLTCWRELSHLTSVCLLIHHTFARLVLDRMSSSGTVESTFCFSWYVCVFAFCFLFPGSVLSFSELKCLVQVLKIRCVYNFYYSLFVVLFQIYFQMFYCFYFNM